MKLEGLTPEQQQYIHDSRFINIMAKSMYNELDKRNTKPLTEWAEAAFILARDSFEHQIDIVREAIGKGYDYTDPTAQALIIAADEIRAEFFDANLFEG